MGDIELSQVLLVDDSLTDAELTIHALKISGRAPRVTWLADAEEAVLFMFRARQYSDLNIAAPHLIILDVDMPGMGGIGVLQRVKRDPNTKRIPIVMLSSRQDRLTAQRCYELGANSYVVKPVAAVDYFQKIAEIANYWLKINEPSEEEIEPGSAMPITWQPQAPTQSESHQA